MSDIRSIAIVGSGIAGLTAAHLLHKRYDITLFESNDYIGGHTNTIDVDDGHRRIAVDTGFIVFNERTYPNFIRLLRTLRVEMQVSNMSFSFSSTVLGVTYSGDTINSLFAQRKQLISPKFYRLLYDIGCFNRQAKHFIQQHNNDMTLEEFISTIKFGRYFHDCYLNPLASAIWSTPACDVGQMPAKFILQFYANHGLLDILNRPQWYVVKSGSNAYVKKMIRPFVDNIHVNDAVLNIKRDTDAVTLTTQHGSIEFDAVVVACHSDQALAMLEQPSIMEQEILGKIEYIRNTATLHTDISALPQNKRAWASWNYMQHHDQTSLTYYMNKLQSIDSEKHFCVSINNQQINPYHIIKTIEYEHPLYTQASVVAKGKHHLINNHNRTFYVGAYWGNGFHEDGVRSSLQALAALGVSL